MTNLDKLVERSEQLDGLQREPDAAEADRRPYRVRYIWTLVIKYIVGSTALLTASVCVALGGEAAIVLWEDRKPIYPSIPVNVNFVQSRLPDPYIQYTSSVISVINEIFERPVLQLQQERLTTIADMQHRKPLLAIGVVVGSKYAAPYNRPERSAMQAAIYGVEFAQEKSSTRLPPSTAIDVITKSMSIAGSDANSIDCTVGIFYVGRTVGHSQMRMAGSLTPEQSRKCLFIALMYAIGFDVLRLNFRENVLHDVLQNPTLMQWNPTPQLLPAESRRAIQEVLSRARLD